MRRTCNKCKANDFTDQEYCSLGFKREYQDGIFSGTKERCPKPLSTPQLFRAIKKRDGAYIPRDKA